MGWSWSPVIAQSLTMGMVIEVLADCGFAEEMKVYRTLNTPPSLIAVDKKLVAAVWYDNILLVTTDFETAQKFYQKWSRMAESFNLEMKSWNLHPASKLKWGSKQRPAYLGLEFCMCGKRGREDSTQLHWRHSEKRVATFAKAKQLLKDHQRFTPRLIAKICGSLMWDAHISGIPLCRKVELLNIIRDVGSSARKLSWDSRLHISAETVAYLTGELSVAEMNEWRTLRPEGSLQNVFAATDSSDNMWGALGWDSDGKIFPIADSRPWPENLVGEHIFIKELLAATITIEKICSTRRRCRIYIITDNTAAAAVLRRLASSSHAGNELASRVDKALTDSECSLNVIIVPSAVNPADEPSRGKKLSKKKMRFIKTKVVPAALRFCRANVPVPNVFRWSSTAPLRHVEEEAEEAEIDWFRWNDPSTE